MEKSAGNSLLTGITRSIENLPQPQTRQNDSTIFEMPRRSPEAWVRRDQPINAMQLTVLRPIADCR
jgi:hypothetical protein